MAEKKASSSGVKKVAKRASEAPSKRFSADERAAMKERAQELKAEGRASPGGKAGGEGEVLAKIAQLPPGERAMAQRIHEIVKTTAPSLVAKTWYGMPAYAKDGSVVCFFQSAAKFKTRYATFGFSDKAKLDDGDMWPTAFALIDMSPSVEKTIAKLVKQAVS